MVVGGRTQYLARVQGMPKQVKDSLRKRIWKFFWGDKKNPVREEIIFAQPGKGEQGVLDIRSRNEAIQIMWVKEYLKLTDRPLWACFADRILALNKRKCNGTLPTELKGNMFLQTWRPKLNGPTNRCPKDLKTMIATALKYGTRLEAIKITRDAAREMPIWAHARENAKLRMATTSNASICLRTKHRMRLVGDAEKIANHLTHPQHRRSKRCGCPGCAEAKNIQGCTHPKECFKRARQLLDNLPAKWDPRKINDRVNREDEPQQGWKTFNHRSGEVDNLEDAMRIFTNGHVSDEQAPEGNNQEGADELRRITKVATDGSCLRATTREATAGAGIFYAPGDERNMSIRVPNTFAQTNQTGEMVAILAAIKNNNPGSDIEIESDSKYAIETLTKNLANLEDTGYIGKANKELIQITVAKLRTNNRTSLKWVKGHNGHAGNEAADRLADEGAKKPLNERDEMNEEIPARVKLTGAKLSKMTQSLAYKAIREIALQATMRKNRERTAKMIDTIQNHVEEVTEETPTEERIWKAIRNNDFSRQIRYYLWMVAHDAYCIGTLNMSHILSRCETPGQEQIWELAKELWTKTGRTWTQPWIGNIIACALTKTNKEKGERDPGGDRLWRILISESAYLIWKLRCERVIQNENASFTTQEVTNRWIATMNARLDLDREMTNECLGKHKIRTKVVLQTWKGALDGEENLPRNWTKLNGVFSGY
ncbi:hypothetical protein PC9H_002246 [Pleurotus ostreatus]|uniref:ribonuclease H n=1 Tax=Pleurotus ostreatus TaxID=5322 RepID=A0A8H6ZLB5_PLEOS|nr:uncharacterized protein PC9H_002246 [Pleurotus ostreatus]KAF7419654.1 hypothetical protein PC9H_002246 [Pleurotus ostreatus]KAJ8689472.1 hypothetical protein PTI98_012374 [Pleurotus ostreatus]